MSSTQMSAQHAQKFKEAQKAVKDAKKLSSGGFFSKSKPEQAEPLLDEARKKLRAIRPQPPEVIALLVECLTVLAEVRYDQSFHLDAAKSMEEAARLMKDNDNMEKAVQYYEKAAFYYRNHKGGAKYASDQYKLAAELVGENDIKKAIELFNLAVEIQEDEISKTSTHYVHDYIDAAVKFCVTNERFDDTRRFLEKQIENYERDTEKWMKRIWRNVCSLMIIEFHLLNSNKAQEVYTQALNKYSNHGKYPEMALCQSLMDAFAYANEEMLATVHKSGDLGLFLFHPIANLAKKLNMKDVKPMVTQNNDNNNNSNNNNNNQQNNPFAQDVTNDQLQSEANNTNINDDTGAPDLLD